MVVDDGSSDGTPEVLTRIAAGDPRVRIHTTDHTGFPGAARNAGVAVAGGRLLAFLDSDDRWLPGKLLAQVPLHEPDTDVLISHTRERWLRGDREVSQRTQRHRRRGDVFADSLNKCILGPSTVVLSSDLYRRSGGFRADVEVAEDYEYWLRLTCRHPVAYVDRPLTEKRAGPWDQLSERYGQIEGFRLAVLRDLVRKEYFRACAGDQRQRAAEATLARKLRVFAAGARKRHRRDEARALEREAERLDPRES